MLTISEQLLLLALHDEKGSVVFSASTALPYGLAGAVLLDLYFLGIIAFEGKHVRVVDARATDSDVLDEALELMRQSTKSREPKYWVSRIQSKVKRLQQRLAEDLVEKQILSKEERKLLWVFTRRRYPTDNAEPEYDIRNAIRNVILYGQHPSEKEAALISLMSACELVNEVFSKEERKSAKQRIKMLSEGNEVSKAVSAVVTEITAAIMVVMIAATTASTTSS